MKKKKKKKKNEHTVTPETVLCFTYMDKNMDSVKTFDVAIKL